MFKVAILVDLELSRKSGGHVKFWERIYKSLEKEKLNCYLEFFFLGKKKDRKVVNKFISLNIIKPIFSSSFLRFFGIDADYTDLSPVNPSLYLELKKFDLIHTTDQLFTMSKTAKLVSRKYNIPLTSSYHTDAPNYTKFYVSKILNHLPFSGFFISKLKLPEKVAANQTTNIISYFKYCKKIMINDFSYDNFRAEHFQDKIIKLERGIDKKIFKKKNINKLNFLRKYNINADQKIIFFCGRIHELKGALFLSEIHKILTSRNNKVTTILAGENLQGDECKRLGGRNLVLLDHIDEKEISSFLNICDLFVFPSLYETGPQVVLEAKSCQAVCIVSPNGGGRRIKKSGEDGIIIKKYEANTWAEKIEDLLSNNTKIHLIKKKLKNDNFQKSWKDIFFQYFFENWKELTNK
jgi:glycosyltransferase involved in cell wall biosynthesis